MVAGSHNQLIQQHHLPNLNLITHQPLRSAHRNLQRIPRPFKTPCRRLFHHLRSHSSISLRLAFATLYLLPTSMCRCEIACYMYTLYPGTPVSFIATFAISKSPPRPSLPHQSLRPRGIHGLEIRHKYVLRPGQGWGWVRWWEYGEKDEVINPPTGKLDGRTVA